MSRSCHPLVSTTPWRSGLAASQAMPARGRAVRALYGSSFLAGASRRPRWTSCIAAGTAVFVILTVPFAQAQEAPKPSAPEAPKPSSAQEAPKPNAQEAPKPKKKGAKPAASAPAAAPSDSAAEPSAVGGPAAAPPPAGSAAAASSAAKPGELPNLPPEPEYDIWNTKEDASKRYYFVGLQYRGTIIPQFLVNLFVNDGATVYSNSIGAEIDIRKGGQSLIPWIKYTDYNTGDILFLQKGQPDYASNRSVVNSSLKSLYLGLDELWSVPIANHLDFEFGFGVGIGAVWGDLMNNWVYVDNTKNPDGSPHGQYKSTNGNYYSKCATTASAITHDSVSDGCTPSFHTSQNPAKVGGYIEPNWFNGGPVPVVFPHISIPQFSLRYKPIKQFETRLSLGFGLTGFWFGLSADYGLERPEDSKAKTAHGLQVRDTL